MDKPLTGILPIAPTPFLDDAAIDAEGMCRVVDCLIDQSVDAIRVLADYSGQFLLTHDERTGLMRVSLEQVAGRVPVIATISHFCTASPSPGRGQPRRWGRRW